MKRKDFFKKLGIGTAGVILSPKILEALDNMEPTKVVVVPKKGAELKYANDILNQYNELVERHWIEVEKQILFGRQWTPDQEQILLKTRK